KAVIEIGEPAAGFDYFDDAVRDLTELSSLAPDHSDLLTELAWIRADYGAALAERRETRRAAEQIKEAIATWERHITKNPAPIVEQHLADLLANCPINDLRDPKRAIVLAHKAFDSSGSDSLPGSILASSLYRAGDIERAMALLSSAGEAPLARNFF